MNSTNSINPMHQRMLIRERKSQQKRRETRKTLVLNHYSNNTLKSNCCGKSEHLKVDHINGRKDESEHGNKLYSYLITHNFPKGYQILCEYCNAVKRNKKECPCRLYLK